MNPKARGLLYALEKTEDSREPALVVGGGVAVATATVYLITHFYPDFPPDLANAIAGVLTILVPLITSWLIRRKVWSPSSVAMVVNEAVAKESLASNSPKSSKLRLKSPIDNPDTDTEDLTNKE